MNFYDTITEMGYTMSKMDDIIDISKEDVFGGKEPIGEIHIVFYTKEKEIIGFVKPLRNFRSVDDISYFYHKIFLSMQKDLKTLADKSGYDII